MAGELRQRRPVVKRRRDMTKAEREAEHYARWLFKTEVLRLDTGRCIGATTFASDHECDGPLEAHHAIPQKVLRTHISTLELTEAEIRDWLWHPDVGVTLCRRSHARHTTRMETVPWEWLPARVLDFCEARDVKHLALREHPPFVEDVR